MIASSCVAGHASIVYPPAFNASHEVRAPTLVASEDATLPGAVVLAVKMRLRGPERATRVNRPKRFHSNSGGEMLKAL
jgi:hypothetical protein